MPRSCFAVAAFAAACGGSGSHDLVSVDLVGLDGFAYTAPLTLGGQTFQAQIDTGSTTAAVADSQCSSCAVTPEYTPGSTATDTDHTASTTYGDMSNWSGEVFADTASVGDTPDVHLAFAAITTQTEFFTSNSYQGILGLGPPDLLEPDTTSFASQTFAAGVDSVMAFELCGDTGTATFGGFDAALASSPPQFTAMLPISSSEPYYAINLGSMTVGSASVGTGSALGNALVDTGTSLTYLPTDAENALIAAVNGSPAFQTLFEGVQISETQCLEQAGLTAATVDSTLPPLSFTVAGSSTTIDVPASRSYLYDMGGGEFCLAFGDAGALGLPAGFAVLGDTFMSGTLTVFDVGGQRIGFAPDIGCNAGSAASAIAGRAERRPWPRVPGQPWWAGSPDFHPPPTLR